MEAPPIKYTDSHELILAGVDTKLKDRSLPGELTTDMRRKWKEAYDGYVFAESSPVPITLAFGSGPFLGLVYSGMILVPRILRNTLKQQEGGMHGSQLFFTL